VVNTACLIRLARRLQSVMFPTIYGRYSVCVFARKRKREVYGDKSLDLGYR
jgi:hypothetical protein